MNYPRTRPQHKTTRKISPFFFKCNFSKIVLRFIQRCIRNFAISLMKKTSKKKKFWLHRWSERVKNFNTQRNKSAAGPFYERKTSFLSETNAGRSIRVSRNDGAARRFSGEHGLKIGGFRETIRLFSGSRCANRRSNSTSTKRTCVWTHYVTYTWLWGRYSLIRDSSRERVDNR